MTAPGSSTISPLRLGACVAVAAAVLSALFLAPAGDTDTPAPPPGAPAAAAIQRPLPLQAEPPVEGALNLTESGYTPLRDLVGDQLLSWGGVVENTASALYAVPTVRATFTAGGEEVTLESPVGAIAPGTKSAVGGTDYIPSGKLGKVTVSVVAVRWVDTVGTPLVVSVSEIEATWIGAGDKANYWSSDGISFPVDERGDLVVTFRAESQAPTLIRSPVYVALYRDADGRILGAHSDVSIGDVLPPGWCLRDFRVNEGPPEKTAEDGVEVYVLVP